MIFEKGIDKRYRESVEAAFDAIIAQGNDEHRRVMRAILDSELLIRVAPVSELNASGITGVINPIATNLKLATERIGMLEALGEIYIAIAEETIDTGGQRGCEGTFVHEGRHAYDFAQTISSLSNADVNPLGVFDPTLYEMELAAHKTSGDYMLCVNRDEYLDEGLQLRLLCREGDGPCIISEDGIYSRLRDSYGLAVDANQGATASEMMGIRV